VRIDNDKGDSDWQPLGTLVRLPKIEGVVCHEGSTCRLKGDDLFLIAAVSASPKFQDPVTVPNGFPGDSIEVPHPHDGRLYVKLHDDPDVISIMRVKLGAASVAKRRPASGESPGASEPAPSASSPAPSASSPAPSASEPAPSASSPAQSSSPSPGAPSGPSP
jgi:hypothetical protein